MRGGNKYPTIYREVHTERLKTGVCHGFVLRLAYLAGYVCVVFCYFERGPYTIPHFSSIIPNTLVCYLNSRPHCLLKFMANHYGRIRRMVNEGYRRM